jgi:hypothetical protein
MNDAHVIETSARTAGLAIRYDYGYRFFASDEAFYTMDGDHFPSIRALQAAVDRLGRTVDAGGRRRSAA